MTSLEGAIARKYPQVSEETICNLARDIATELHAELCRQSLKWRTSGDVGAKYREQEARRCASIVFSLGEAK